MNVNNMGDMIRNAGRIRKEIDRVQESLKERVVEAEAGSGRVTVLVNGQQELLKITIDPEIVSTDPEDIELLEDMIIAAVSQAVEKSKTLKQREIDKVTGGLGDGLAGLFGRAEQYSLGGP